MIKYELRDGTKFEVPNSLYEIPFNDFVKLEQTEDLTEQIKILTKLNETTVLANIEELTAISSILTQFVWELDNIAEVTGIEIDGEFYLLPENLESESIGQFIDCQMLLSLNSDNIFSIYPKIISTYISKVQKGSYIYDYSVKLSEKINGLNTAIVASAGKKLINQYIEVKKKYDEQLKKQAYKQEEEVAGVHDFLDKWGFYATMDYLCGGDILKYDAFCELSVSTVYMNLIYRQDKKAYEDDLYEILKLKNEQK